MTTISATELLNVWEAGLHKSLIEKSLHLLNAAYPVIGIDDLANLSIGERDAGLLKLREAMFGSRLVNIVHCPACSELIEWETNLKDLQLQTFPQVVISKEYALEVDNYNIRFRLPNSRDLAKATLESASYGDPKKLLSECILDVRRDQEICVANELPEQVFATLNRRMGEEDPQADMWMLLSCPCCSYQWNAQFDIVTYLWSEIDSWARHILHEVNVLAKAYGWSENDILNLSYHRRQLYLEMVRS